MPSIQPGDRFGRWTVAALSEVRIRGGLAYLCICECGTFRVVERQSLHRGRSKSCGCAVASRAKKHGHTWQDPDTGKTRCTKEYSAWKDMKRRCDNPSFKNSKHYFERGIGYCEEWKSFKAFLGDMGLAPSKSHTLERIDNNLGYSRSNCTWATQKDQCKNTRRTIRLTIDGETRCASDWADLKGIPRNRLYNRIKRGIDPKLALEAPPKSLVSPSKA